ncbi:uncharacterized protein BXIN_1391 [Babesia sp. Xinjiang]|uniref:uncharacterized protein n=1 Tax=Babesia sp. Xinjiang TaxID=462227 RepID=UPI000A23DE3A|nr:uncharacterized protein BXIN_1391 [Babesia sp. Xinjiang]ORM39962.1 hypothetical protein BXIN_1391 [Babesia sp. Xinjiang]
MKDNTSFAANSFQKVAAPQRRTSFGATDALTGSYAQQAFDPSSSSREMRKIMYYENMFSKMDSQDKMKKTSGGSNSTVGSSDHRAKDDGDDTAKSAAKIPRQNNNNNRKSATGSNTSDVENRNQRTDRTHKPETDASDAHRIQMENAMMHKPIIPKRDTIAIKIKTQNLNSFTHGEAAGKAYGTSHEAFINGVEDNSARATSSLIRNVTDISGTKISKMLGIDQIASTPSGLSASQRQWIVPSFAVNQPEPTLKQSDETLTHVTQDSDTTRASDSPYAFTETQTHEQRTEDLHMTTGTQLKDSAHANTSPQNTYSVTTTQTRNDLLDTDKIPRKQEKRVSRFQPREFIPDDNPIKTNEPIKEEPHVDAYTQREDPQPALEPESGQESQGVEVECEPNIAEETPFQDSGVESHHGYEDMDIVVNEQDMDVVTNDDIMDYDPVIKEEEDEEYIPEMSIQSLEGTSSKKSSKRKSKSKKAAALATPTISTPTSDVNSAFDPLTPDAVVDDTQAETTHLVRSTRSRTGGRNGGRNKKKDISFTNDQDDMQPIAKASKSSMRSSSRSIPNNSRKNVSDTTGTKSQYNVSGQSTCNDTPERQLKKAFADSRIISVSEAEKIIDLYQQHNAELERLKRIILSGDLSEFGKAAIEEAATRIPKLTCTIDPRFVMAQPMGLTIQTKQEQPPQNPIELSLKYRLLTRLMDNK